MENNQIIAAAIFGIVILGWAALFIIRSRREDARAVAELVDMRAKARFLGVVAEYRKAHPEIADIWREVTSAGISYDQFTANVALQMAAGYTLAQARERVEDMLHGKEFHRDGSRVGTLTLSEQTLYERVMQAQQVEIEGDPLPAALAHTPNMGGLGNPKYEGPNYVGAEEFAASLRKVPFYDHDAVPLRRRAFRDRKPAPKVGE